MKIEIGKKYKIDYGPNNINNKLIHIRGIIDDRVVFKHYSKYTQRWIYEIVTLPTYKMLFANYIMQR